MIFAISGSHLVGHLQEQGRSSIVKCVYKWDFLKEEENDHTKLIVVTHAWGKYTFRCKAWKENVFSSSFYLQSSTCALQTLVQMLLT